MFRLAHALRILPRKRIRTGALGLALLGSLAWSGCASMESSATIPIEAVARYSPAPEVVSPTAALDLAQAYVREHPGSDFAIGSGDSMLPLYHDRAVILLNRPALATLKPGETVVFRGTDGLPVAHVIVGRCADGWVTRGLNNEACDPDCLSESRYIGVVVKAYQPTASVILAYAGTSAYKAYTSVPAISPRGI